ncbi:glycosyltransferase [Aureimonas fodinaquatilis]|uniref:Glycosyltransferase n=1 Tax=Aureimonas fodinaquatilis TaxID=2565783 RepID=A0A5B0DYL3_9HYPH|nr:glycosyltransferase [Aureimonas fodinaquatilis]KAA0971874.1 glycosyltransferase [Aureimonas fodinaquatilis]
MRVLQGVTGQAGQPDALARGLRGIGVEARSCIVHRHKFNYPADLKFNFADPDTLGDLTQRLLPLIEKFDVFHFHARSFAMAWPDLHYPSLLDLLILKQAGKKVFFHFRGQEIRLPEPFAAANPFHYVDEPAGHIFKKLPTSSKLHLRQWVNAVCDGVFAVDPEIQSYVPGSIVVPRVLDAAQWPFRGIGQPARPLVVHAPSRRGIKGSDYVLAAVETLRTQGLQFDFTLVENMTHAQARKVYEQADIIIDQLRIGWHGVLAVEAMALGKPVIAYIRDDLWQAHGADLPVANANPMTIARVLGDLLQSVEKRQQLSHDARAYFMKTHDATAVAHQLQAIYARPAKAVDVATVAEFLDQAIRQNRIIAKAKRRRWQAGMLWRLIADEGPAAAGQKVITVLRKHLRK